MAPQPPPKPAQDTLVLSKDQPRGETSYSGAKELSMRSPGPLTVQSSVIAHSAQLKCSIREVTFSVTG